MIEIEVKAHINDTDWARLQQELPALYGVPKTVNKRDTYLVLPQYRSSAHIRIRQTETECYCTVKKRHIADGIERNTEEEFRVDEHDACCATMQLFGFKIDIRKHKIGYAYRHNTLLIEIVEVVGLGHFIEIERLISEAEYSPVRAKEISTQLLQLLDTLKISRQAIEPQRYIDLLRA